jgi:hypothetical protein
MSKTVSLIPELFDSNVLADGQLSFDLDDLGRYLRANGCGMHRPITSSILDIPTGRTVPDV